MRQMGFVGKSRLEAAQRLLPDALSAWRSQWCFECQDTPIELPIVTAEAVGDASVTAKSWQHVAASNGALWFGVCESTSWHRLVFGEQAEEVPADQVATYLIQQAQLALVNALLKVLQQAPVKVIHTETPTAIAAAYSPRVLLTISGQKAAVFILLDASLLNTFLPNSVTKPSLLDRQQAIGSARIKLKLSLPLSEVAIEDLSDIHPGDILKTASPLSQTFHLSTECGDVVAEGFLVRADTRLAVQLIDR